MTFHSFCLYSLLFYFCFNDNQFQMNYQQVSVSKKGRRGQISKKLAALENKMHSFHRGKKGIKKQNSQICRQAREKKKQYITSLESRIKGQQATIITLKEEIDALKTKLSANGVNDLKNEYRQLVQGLTLKDQPRITRSLAVLRSRFGIAGRDRNKWMEQHLMRVVQLTVPMHLRLLLQNCDNSKTFFELLGGGDQMKACRMNFSEDKKAILMQMKPKIKKTKQNYDRTLQRLQQAWAQLKRNGQDSQRIIDEIEEKVNHPVFVGNLLMTLDSERSRNVQIYPLNYFKHLCSEQYLCPLQEEPPFFAEQPEDRLAFDLYFNDFT